MDNIDFDGKKPKRILGMTIAQVVFLGCLALTALGTICGGLTFISGSMGATKLTTSSPALPSTMVPTFTPYLSPTPTVTLTPTLIPYEDLIPSGWNQYTTATIELWVPPEYKPVDVEEEYQAVIDVYKKLGLDDMAEVMGSSTPNYIFWFKESGESGDLYISNITVESVFMTADNLDGFLDQLYADAPGEVVLVNRGEVQGSNYEIRRVLSEMNINNININTALYVIFDGVNVWVITCATHLNEFYTLLPEYDKVARSFRVLGE